MINSQRLLSTFLEYIQIDSESCNEARFATRVAEDLKAIGCQVSFDDSVAKTGSNTGNLYAILPGNCDREPIIFSSHMDTVTPGVGIEPVVENGRIYSKGHTILGGDDKSGIVAVVEALRTIVEKDLCHPTIQVVFTVCEEVGLRGSSNVDTARLVAKNAIVLDSGGDAGEIVVAAPGQYVIKGTVTGRRAHAGVAPETGISAIMVLAEAITSMQLLRIDEETTANFGTIDSHFATNIVAETATFVAECRSRNEEKLEVQKDHMLACLQDACDKYGATVEIELNKPYGGYSYTQEDALVKKVMAACDTLGLTARTAASGGGSDANNFNNMGLKAVNLGTGMAKVHTTDEEITVTNLENTARLVLTLATC